MIDPVTVSESFIAWLEGQGIGTFGEDIFLNQVPQDAPDDCWRVITSGGAPVLKLKSGESVKQYFVSIYYRALLGKNAERKLFELEEKLNCANCVVLTGFDILEIEATQYPSDVDLENEERRVGFLQATVRLYKPCD